MAVPWSTLFSAIPWSDVITKAPEIAQGARKLWQKVGKRGDTPPPAASAPAAPAVAATDARLDELDARLADVAARQQESAELLAALAGQNADLIRVTEELRARVRQLGIAAGVLAVGLTAVVAALLLRTG